MIRFLLSGLAFLFLCHSVIWATQATAVRPGEEPSIHVTQDRSCFAKHGFVL